MSNATIATPGTGSSPDAPASRRRAVLVGAVALVLVVAVVGGWLALSGSDKAPYSDARSTGTLTLCGTDGKPVTSGSIADKPFVNRAVGATAAQGLAAGNGKAATLYAFQPREGTGSDEWSGQLLTAASSYTNTEHPMAQATDRDVPLRDFLAAFPTRWDGYLQIRLYLTSLSSAVGDSYDSVDVKVDGDSWKVVGDAGTSSCTDGDAVSSETKSSATP